MWWWDIPELMRWGIVAVAIAMAIGLIITVGTVYEAAKEALEFFQRENAAAKAEETERR